MAEDRLRELAAAVDRAAATMQRLRRERRRLQDKVATLREHVHRLEHARRDDRVLLRRLELLELERAQVRQRLELLLERLEPPTGGDAQAPETTAAEAVLDGA